MPLGVSDTPATPAGQGFGTHRRLRAGGIALGSILVAKSQVLREHTTALDRALGAACYCSVIACLILLLGSYLISVRA